MRLAYAALASLFVHLLLLVGIPQIDHSERAAHAPLDVQFFATPPLQPMQAHSAPAERREIEASSKEEAATALASAQLGAEQWRSDPLEHATAGVEERADGAPSQTAGAVGHLAPDSPAPEEIYSVLHGKIEDPVLAGYLIAWAEKVERLGNSRYPSSLSQRGLSGAIQLRIRLSRDGRLLALESLSSSGDALLDQAARKTVLSATPFAPFPPSMARRWGQIEFDRTLEFSSSRRVRTR